MAAPTRSSGDETGRLGDEIYESHIRPHVEDTRQGKIVAIDVDSGDYVIADTVIAAADDLKKQRPNARVWLRRIGHRALYHFGGSSMRSPR